MNYKNIFKPLYNQIIPRNESLEELLLEIEADNKDKDNINFNKYKNRILRTVTKELMNNGLNKEDKKELYQQHTKNLKEEFFYIKRMFKWFLYFLSLLILNELFVSFFSQENFIINLFTLIIFYSLLFSGLLTT